MIAPNIEGFLAPSPQKSEKYDSTFGTKITIMFKQKQGGMNDVVDHDCQAQSTFESVNCVVSIPHPCCHDFFLTLLPQVQLEEGQAPPHDHQIHH